MLCYHKLGVEMCLMLSETVQQITNIVESNRAWIHPSVHTSVHPTDDTQCTHPRELN